MGKDGALTKNNPARRERDRSIAAERLKGKTYRELSEQFGLSKSALHYILNDDEIKDVIETGTREMVELVPKAVDNYRELLNSDDEKIRLQASKECLQTTGIMPSHTPSILIQQVFNQSDPKISEELEQLREFLAAKFARADKKESSEG